MLYIVRSVFGQINSVLKGSNAGAFDNNQTHELSEEALVHLYELHSDKNKEPLEKVLAYSLVEQLAYRWLVFNEKALIEAEHYPNRVKVISYDYLCEKPEQCARDIFKFLKLDFHQQSQKFIMTSTSSHNDTFYSVNKDPVKARSSWKKNFDQEQVAKINNIISGSLSEKITKQ